MDTAGGTHGEEEARHPEDGGAEEVVRFPDRPLRRTWACLLLSVASPAAFSFVAGALVVLQDRLYDLGVPFAAVGALLWLTIAGGMAGSAYAALHLPFRLSRRVAAAVAACVLAYVLTFALTIATTAAFDSLLRW